jgi:hypothetical protein
MLSLLLGIIPGLFTTVNGITNAISNERLKLIDAKTDQQKIAAQERINSLQAKRDVMIAESGASKINAVMRACLAAPVAIVLGKIYVWDKVIGSLSGCAGVAGQTMDCLVFRTDVLDANLWTVITATIAFYFLYEGAVNVTRIAKS